MSSEEKAVIDALINGLEKLRRGCLLAIISSVVGVIGSIALMIAGVGAFAAIEGGGISIPASLVAASIGLLVVILILSLLAFIEWFRASDYMRDADERFGIGKTGMIVALIGLLIYIIGYVAFLAAVWRTPKPSLAILMTYSGVSALGGILWLVGFILFGLMLTRAGEHPKLDRGFRTAGILLIIGIVVLLIAPLIGFIILLIAYYLVYKASSSSLEMLRTASTETKA